MLDSTYPRSAATAIFLSKAGRIVAPSGFRLGLRVPAVLSKRHPETAEPLPLRPASFGALLFGVEPTGALPSFGRGALSLAGEQIVVKPGDGDILVAMLIRRRSELTHSAFLDRWLNGHARFGLATAAVGYRQLHPECAPEKDGFDGAALVLFRDRDHAASARAAPEIARDATADEMQFIDHGQSMLMMFDLSGGERG